MIHKRVRLILVLAAWVAFCTILLWSRTTLGAASHTTFLPVSEALGSRTAQNGLLGVDDPPWYNLAWQYRLPVTITNTGTALTDYQVLVALDSGFDFTHAQADGEDVRVTEGDGVTELSCWIETWDSTSQVAWVWVKVPSVPVGETLLYLYYGNASAVSVSDGKGTFVVYDGFEAYDVGSVPTGDYSNPGEWDRYAGNPVLTPGPAAWDAAGATFASVISDTVAGEYRMYYHGIPSSGPHQIGLATSPDGLSWTKYAGNPVMMVGGTGTWDASGVRVPMVWKEGANDYRMIYTGSGSGGLQVGYATSTDGITWAKYVGNPVFNDPTWAHGSTENWGVIKVGSEYLMWYSDMSAPRESGIAVSTDLINWTPYTTTPIFATSGVPTDYFYSQYCPYTFVYGGYYYVLVPSYTSVGDYARYYLYRSSSPYFPTSDRHLVRVAHTVGGSGQWDALDSDTPAVLTMDIERSEYPNDQLWTYYAGAAVGGTWREGLLIETDIAAALADAALPGGTLSWSASGDVTVVDSPVRQGLRSVQLNDTLSTTSTNVRGNFTTVETGSLGVWMRRNNITVGDDDIYLYEGSTLAVVAGLGRNGVFHYWNRDVSNPPGGYGTGFHDTSVGWAVDTWYLVTVDFDATTDQYDFVVYDQSMDEVVRVDGVAFGNVTGGINGGVLYTDSTFVGLGFGDDYRLRKDVDQEPTVDLGDEQDLVDVGISKSASAATVYLGQPFTYTLMVTNNLTTTASAVVVTDTLPAEVAVVSVTTEQGSCVQGAEVVCTLGDVPGSETVAISMVVTATVEGQTVNTAVVDSADFDLVPEDNEDSVTTTVLPSADLSVSQTSTPVEVRAGEQLTYTITVNNDGPSTSGSITLTDTLPIQVQFVSAEPITYCVQANPVACTLPGLMADGSSQVQIVVLTTDDGWITNTVTVESPTYDPALVNNTSQRTIEVLPQADLSVSQVDTPDPVYAGDPLTYTLTVQNAGPSRANNITLTDTPPSGVTVLSATPSQGSCTMDSGVTCNLDYLHSGENAEVVVVVSTSLDGLIANTAIVTSSTYDGNLGNNTSVAYTTVLPAVDLWVSQIDTPDPARAGLPLTYTITVTNTGPSSSAAVTLTDNLPASVVFVSAEPSAYCVQASPVMCTLPGLPAGGSSQVQVVVTPLQDGLITNLVTVATTTYERNLENNSDEEVTVVATATDLSVTMDDFPDPVIAEQELTYLLTVHNAGPSIAGSVQLTDTLPVAVTIVSVTPQQGSCLVGDVITCDLGNIIDGADIVVEVVVLPQAEGTLINTVEVSTGTYEDDLENNFANEETTVLPLSADLSLSLADDPDPVVAGEILTYTVQVSNLGPSRAISPSVTVDLPAQVIFSTSEPDEPFCTHLQGVVSCQLAELAALSHVDITITVQVESSTFAAQILSQAEVTSLVADPVPGNNDDSEVTDILREADLWIDIIDNPDPVAPGRLLTYTLAYTNQGASDAIDLLLIDTLPPEVDYVGATPAVCTPLSGTPFIRCSPQDLGAGQSAQIDLVVSVKGDTVDPIVNQVVISSATYDPNPENNESIETTAIDDVPPYLQWVAPMASDEYPYIVVIQAGLEITLTVVASDTVGIDRVQFIRWDHDRSEYVEIGFGEEVSPNVYQYVWVFQSYLELPMGQNQIYAYAFDPADNFTRKRIYIQPFYHYNLFLPTVGK